MPAEQFTLSAHNLARHFGRHCAVRDVSLQLRQGEVLGLLGSNGAGKSTTLQMLAGMLRPGSGSIQICEYDLLREPERAKACIGFLPETPPLYRDMRVDDYLLYAARLRRITKDKLPDALQQTKQRCGLHDAGRKFIGTLSKGYQQRIGIAQAIIHQPHVIILDEPTTGLDPAQMRDMRALIRELGDAHSVILSTHLLAEAEQLCDRIAIMREGRLIFSGSRDELKQYGEINLEDRYLQITRTEQPA
jgi:ABC-2 type transport system ATP-binding protein